MNVKETLSNILIDDWALDEMSSDDDDDDDDNNLQDNAPESYVLI